ncbi:uncharacterized protein LOC143242429 isoform X4 [Tachypleus tridentatus]|uniref:uncharacterized protein LOC143242429 isoform X4 n=1 Tax=Tachypleus tridentatus TaxID=6853 RepID=UPI003FD6A46B
MAFKFNFPAPCRHVSDAEQDNCEEACEGRICPSEGKVPINRGGETVWVEVSAIPQHASLRSVASSSEEDTKFIDNVEDTSATED